MYLTRIIIFIAWTGLNLLPVQRLTAQCAVGTIMFNGFTSTGGSGTYADPATGVITVNYCFQITHFTELSTNWIHGVFISFDNLPKGAVVSEGPTGSQPTQHGNRFWVFLDSAKAKNLNLPGPGFYVDDGDQNPKNNYGDNGEGTPKARFPDIEPFCFVIKIDCGSSLPLAFVPKVTVTGDGTTGGWTNSACPGDLFRSVNDGPNGNGSVVVCGIVLPVKLFEFTGEAIAKSNIIRWTAYADNLFSHFVLERRTETQNDFESLVKIDPVRIPTGNSIHSYTYIDEKPTTLNWYRLKMIEKDGNYEYSKIISVKQKSIRTGNKHFSISPNPSREIITLKNETDSYSGEIEINIIDVLGRVVCRSSFSSSKQEPDFTLDINHLHSGMYFIELAQGSQSLERINFIKE